MTRRVSPAELRRLYEQQQLVPAEIAERLGVSSRTVRAWLRRLGIPLRPSPSAEDAVSPRPRRSCAAATSPTA